MPSPNDDLGAPSGPGPGETVARHILDSLPQPIFWKDRHSVYRGCNAPFAAAVGLAHPDQIVGKTDYDLPWPRAEADAYRADDQEVMTTGLVKRSIHEPLQQADGTRLQVETTKTPLRDASGAVWGVLGIYADVTERQRRVDDLREARLMLRAVLDTIPVRVFWKDLDSMFLGCNQLFATDAGLASPEAIVGKRDSDLGWREQSELYRADDLAVMTSGQPKLGYEEPQTTPDGGRIWLRTSKVPLRSLAGEIVGILGTYEDITASKKAEEEQRRLEAQIQHAQKLESLGILAGGIAHDFNNLLVAVLGHADLALASLPQTTPAQHHLEEIRRAAQRASELANQMLAYSGKGRFVVRRLQLNDVVGEMGQLLQAAIPKKVRLHYDLANGLGVVEVDAAQIRQVVMNLVTNAAEAIGDHPGTITLATRMQHVDAAYLQRTSVTQSLPEGEYIFLEVSDNGCGMDAITRERMFEPFFTTKFRGRGLGLAAVLGIVRGHGGTITVFSEPGQGSCFKVLLPARRGEAPTAQPQPVKAAATAAPLRGTVLLVDDEEIVREAAGQMLEHLGFTVLVAVDGAEALGVFRRCREEIRLVLLDMTMPLMDGQETFRELRSLAPDVRVLLASGYNEQDATSHFVGVDKGLAGFIQKPFALVDLEAKIREILV
jgi:two-component system, cell cycle sensor histidine kinase and response regulator CckA